MNKENVRGYNGYDIPCLSRIKGSEKLVVLISHGFGSNKESPTAKALCSALSERGIGSCSYDFPAHGESPADGGMLRIHNCLDDLSAVEEHIGRLCPDAEIAYFSSSFGAYINLIYLALRKHAGRRSFLRSAAVDMPGIFRRGITPEHEAQLDRQGFVVLDYERPLTVHRGFLDDLEAHDVFRLFRPGMAEFAMIHGMFDEIAPIEDARRFAKLAGAELTEVAGGDHRLMIPGGVERVLDAATGFFTKQPSGGMFTVKKLTRPEVKDALRLVWDVFCEFEVPDYPAEGASNFKSFIDDVEMINNLTFYGAYLGDTIVGTAATSNGGDHIALFFVDGRFHRRGIGRKLFEALLKDSTSNCISVHSSPYAAGAYRRLGFTDTDAEQVENGIRFIPMIYAKR